MLRRRPKHKFSRELTLFLAVICPLLLLSFQASTQNNPEEGLPFITNYSPKQFKGSTQVFSVIGDNDGIMYFGIQGNLLEYDGVKWRKQVINFMGNGLIRSFAKDKNGRIYFGDFGNFGYLTKDSLGQTSIVSLIKYLPDSLKTFLDIWSVYVGNEGVYFQSRERIFRLNEKNEVKAWTPETRFMYAFYLAGEYYVHEQGIGLLKLKNDVLELIPGSEFLGQERMQVMLPYKPPPSMENGKKQYLVGLFYSGLFVYDGEKFRPFKTEVDQIIKESTLYKGVQFENGNYGLSTTGKGLAIIDASGKLLQMLNRGTGLQDESVYAVFPAGNGDTWLALDNGISKVEMSSPLTRFTSQSGIFTATQSMMRFENKLYVGTTNGLLKFDEEKRYFETVSTIPQNQTFTLIKDEDHLYPSNDGLFSIKNGKTTIIRSSIGGDMQLSGLYIPRSHRQVMFGGATFGVAVYGRDKQSGNFRFAGFVPGMEDQFWTFAENKDGTVWAGTQGGIIYRITLAFDGEGFPDVKKFTFRKFGAESGLRNALGGVWRIKNENYFPADSCIYHFDDKTNRFFIDTTFGKSFIGSGVEQFDMAEDSSGRVWIRFGAEILLAEMQPDGKYKIDRTALLPVSEHTIGKIYPDKDGIVWFCTTDGLVRYDGKIKKNYDQSFETLIRHITAGKQVLNKQPATGKLTSVAVGYRDNTLRFEYAAPFYEQEEKTLYQTWLEGFESTWTDWDNNSYKEYTNLPEGNYSFHVRAKNVYRKISEEAVYTFAIQSPAWRSWWAYLLYAIAAATIIYAFIRYRTKHLKEKHKELEKIVSDRTVQLSQRVEELAVINSVQEALVREMDMQAIYDLVGNRIRDVFNSQVVIIASLDAETGLEYFKYAIEKGKRFYPDPRPLDKLRLHLIETKQKIVINENFGEAFRKFGMQLGAGTELPKSAVYVPLTIGDKINSYISLQDVDKEHAFSEPDIRLLETLANSMSVALENARLFDETTRLLKEMEQRTAELAVINSVQDGLAREMNIQAIYDMVGNRICKLFDTQTVLIRTFDHTTGLEQWRFAIERGERMFTNPRPINWANKKLINTKTPLLVNENYLEVAKQNGGTGVSKGEPPKSALFVPMVVGDVVKGSVSLQNMDKENAFNESDLRLLTTLANSMSVALENARLFHETNQRASELSTVNNISKALASQLNLEGLIKLVGDQLLDLFKANIVYIALLDKKTRVISFPYQVGDDMSPLKLGEGLTSKIILTGEPLLINSDVTGATTQFGIANVGIPAASYLGVPIPVGDEVIGVLSVQSTEQKDRFNENDQRLLTTIAASVGVAIRKAKLFEEVEAAKLEAEEATKVAEKANAAKSAFLSTVSHELRTPLTSVLGFAKIIKKRLEERIFPSIDKSDPKTEKTAHQVSENLGVVISEGERLTNLINDVLDLAKIEAGKMEWNMGNVSMSEVAERAMAATSSLFDQKNLKLEKNIEADLPDITGDHDKLIQVIVNLISNAVKFTSEGTITCNVNKKGNEIQVSIADTGIGIAKEDYGAVFEQFKQVGGDTLTDKPKGTGLGLPICKEIVEHHGGHIWLESERGKGSVFYFSLPLQKQPAVKPLQLDELLQQLKVQMAQSKLNKGIHSSILIVDDDNSIRSLLRQELGDAGYHIEEATNGKEAIASIRKQRPDLVILDIMMPEMNGFDVAAILKNDPQTMDIPIIVLSIVQDKARGYRIGIDRYLTKPINTAELFAEVGNLLEQGKSKKKVMVVDEDSAAVKTLTDVLQAKGYQVVESDGKELVEKAVSSQPDIIIINSLLSGKQEIVQSLRFEKGLENVLFLIYQ